MDNIKIITVESMGELFEHVIIDKGNGEFSSMLKTTYDEMIANQASGTIS